jgi:hypothetical protein
MLFKHKTKMKKEKLGNSTRLHLESGIRITAENVQLDIADLDRRKCLFFAVMLLHSARFMLRYSGSVTF